MKKIISLVIIITSLKNASAQTDEKTFHDEGEYLNIQFSPPSDLVISPQVWTNIKKLMLRLAGIMKM